MDGKTAQRGGILPPRCVVCKDMASAFESGILSHKMTTFLILLRRRFWVRISSHLLTVVLHSINIPFRRQKPSKGDAVPPHRSLQKILRKIFGKVTISVIYSVL